MSGSSLKVFSIIQNVNKFITKDKSVEIFKIVSDIWYKRSNEYIIKQCKRIYNDIENGFYNYYDLSIYLLYENIFTEKSKYPNITDKNVNDVVKLFTDKQLEKDKTFIEQLSCAIKINDVAEYFKIKENGGNVLYDDLVYKKRVSPYFYMEFEEEFSNIKNEYEENENLKKFKKIIKKIKQIMKMKELKNG